MRSLTDGGGAADGGGRMTGVQCWVCRLLGRPDFREFSRQILCSRQMSFFYLFIHSGLKPSIFNKYLSSAYYVPGSIYLNKTNKSLPLRSSGRDSQ